MMTIDDSVQNVLYLKLCPEHARNFSIALNVINAPDLAIVTFLGTAALMILGVNAEVMPMAASTEGTYFTSVRFFIMTNFYLYS
jgi:hypothetical protein